jgi:thiol-disulfide isomerase/thioredoxin
LGSVEHDYNEIRGALAEAEGRKLDALTYYAAAMHSRPDKDASKEALELWGSLGGTAEALETWRKPSHTADTISTIEAAMFPPPDAVATSRPLIDFSLLDRNGKQWTLADLKGKTTLINVWATWCGPCREELPQVQALYQKLAERKDFQLVTLNVDSERLLVEPFLKKNNYSFPVIYADWDYLDSFVQKAWGTGIPQTWISDSNGVVRFRLLYDVSDPRWLEKALSTIDKVH